ncbi:glycosyl hydrolase family 25 protein (macronuclear) [Tetrahymena thermophila SB210]|uniref:Glycosyl hydrolase family 25 protein n=1 Tax=Tetrahymena thermophila (strain SB210) TaxID=312017 RepID=Q22R39_TETTS|nr:glycosyl hydrolase family 25 protein [Tetrahymena thermophila SB210]EAR88283.1 glycosyl hydrolase family 25 protein [Tetrahymena thermophila SB210]|eukprot:XP_001008528.1 glycosyl hydrolase family 25 protein [Tetrahymena thermophila SB210]
MIKNIAIALLVLISLQSAQAVIGVDISQSFSNFQCLKNQGIKFVIARAYMSYGAVDTKNVQTLQNAKSVGLITDIYHFPCVGKVSPQAQAQATINSFGSLYGTVWIDVESNPSSGCGWTSNIHTNCQFLVDLVHAYQSHGKLVGIYSSQYQWTSIFGAAGNCPYFTSLPIWYAHYDGAANFNDWPTHTFGGWTKPSIKQYQGTTTLCGLGVDMDYY